MKIATFFLTLTVSLFALSLTAAFAQEEPQRDYFAKDTVVVVADRYTKIPTSNTTATKMSVPLRLTPASVGVVTSALFESQDAIVLGDAMRNVSGVNAQTGFGVFDYFIVRGFESLSNSLVLTDGAAEPEVTFYNLYNVDRVEVLKGPGAFLYGGNPLSGTVNLVRKQPLFSKFFHASGSFGEFTSYRGTVDLGLASKPSGVAFRLNGLWQDSESYRDDKNNSNVSVNPAFTWRPNDRLTLDLNFEYVDSKYKSDAGLPLYNNEIVDVPRTRSYQSPFDSSDQNIYRGRVDFNFKASRLVTLRNKLYYTDLDWLSDGTLFNFVLPNAQGSLDVYRTLTMLDDRQKLFGNQLEALWHFNTGAVNHRLLTGFELSQLADAFTLDVAGLPPIDAFNPVETAQAPGPVFQSQTGDATSKVLAPYFVDHISFSEQVHVFIGGRYDVIDYEDKSVDLKRDFNQFSPMAGATFSPTSSFSVYASAGRAFAPPSTLVQGEREAEESTQFELGFKRQYYEGKLNTTLALYQLEKKNIAIPDDNGVTQQAGDQRSRGVELELAAQPTRTWQAFLAYAYNDAELTKFTEFVFDPFQNSFNFFDRSGNTPAFAPKHLLSFWTNKEYDLGLGFGAGARYIGHQFIAEDNAYEMDSILTFDAMLYYRFGQWRGSVNFKNLTDRKYETRGFGTTSVIPANPFAVYGKLEFTL